MGQRHLREQTFVSATIPETDFPSPTAFGQPKAEARILTRVCFQFARGVPVTFRLPAPMGNIRGTARPLNG